MKITEGARVQIVKHGHTFEGAKGIVRTINRKPNGMSGYIEVELDWDEDWKGGNGTTMILGSRSLKLLETPTTD